MYPRVSHKLPELFQIIIDSDNRRDALMKEPIIPFDRYKELKKDQQAYKSAAAMFVKRQKGGNTQ